MCLVGGKSKQCYVISNLILFQINLCQKESFSQGKHVNVDSNSQRITLSRSSTTTLRNVVCHVMQLHNFPCTNNTCEELILTSNTKNNWLVHHKENIHARGEEFMDEMLMQGCVDESSRREVYELSAKFRALQCCHQQESCMEESE